MVEYYTEALVLDQEDANGSDAFVYLYTQKLGRVRAKAVGMRKITSKLAGHFQPLSFVNARLVEKGSSLLLVDGLSVKKIKQATALTAARIIKEAAPEYQPDSVAWHFIKTVFMSEDNEKLGNVRMLLKALGFEPPSEKCQMCRRAAPAFFSYSDAQFICGGCAKDLKLREDEVQLL